VGFLTPSSRWGILIGIGIPTFLLGIVLLVFDAQEKEIHSTALAGLAALSAVPNLLFFFWTLRKKNDTMAFGILLGCILWALFTFGIKLFG
jgi:ABC-type microcin C transport system permease subunit YejB